jgi:hypothetical protein
MLKNIGLEMCSTDDGNNKYVRKIVSGISRHSNESDGIILLYVCYIQYNKMVQGK